MWCFNQSGLFSGVFIVSRILCIISVVFGLVLFGPGGVDHAHAEEDTFTKEEILAKTRGFFGETTEGLAAAVEKVFEDHGRPNAYILGEEASGAIGVGLRYGEGELSIKGGSTTKIFWQGPSIGFDFGGNASKVFALIYHLQNAEEMYQRIPGVEGTAYIVAGVGVNYQQTGDLIVAPMRTGLGLRGGINVGYLHYGPEHSWVPF